MKKIFIFSILISLGLITLSACTNRDEPLAGSTFIETHEDADLDELRLIDGDYSVIIDKSPVIWHGQRIIGASHTGEITIKSGNLIINNGALSGGEFILDMTSITSYQNIQMLEDHLKSADFFDVPNYPEAKLVISSSEAISPSAYLVKASLRIKSITAPIEFIAELKHDEEKLVVFSDFVIDRTIWDIRYDSGNFFENLGDKAIKNEINFKVSLEAERLNQ